MHRHCRRPRFAVLPTTVTYTFEGEGVHIELAFMTPLLPDDFMVFSRPVTYLSWQVKSTDGKSHAVQLYYDNTAELVVNNNKTRKSIGLPERFGNVERSRLVRSISPCFAKKGTAFELIGDTIMLPHQRSEGGKFLIAASPMLPATTWDRDDEKSVVR